MTRSRLVALEKLLRYTAGVLVLMLTLFMPAFSADEWKKFSPPSGEFSVEIPGDVAVKDGQFGPLFNQKTYYQNAEPVRYSVSVIQCDDVGRYATNILQARLDETGGQSLTSQADGHGWRGILGALSDYKKKYHQTFLFAKAEGSDICYVLYSDVHPESAEMSRFLKSFSVDPARCKSAHANDVRIDKLSEQVGLGILAVFVVTFIATVVVVVRRMKAKNRPS